MTPHRLSQHSLDVWIDQSVPLAVGQVLRFDDESPFYGVVTDLFEEERSGSWLVRFAAVLGQPSLQAQFATLLSERDVMHLIGQHKPQGHGVFSLSDGEKGTLTVLESPRHPVHRQLMADFVKTLSQSHEHVVLVDPEGDWSRFPANLHCTATQDFRLSIQSLGVPAFLSLVGSYVPAPLQPDAYRILSKQVPATPDFIPFLQFLRPERIPELPVKPVLLHVMYRFYQQHVFANHLQEVLDPSALFEENVTHVELSWVEDEFKSLFYQQVVRSILMHLRYLHAEGHVGMQTPSIVLVLSQPDAYLPSMTPTIAALQALGVSVVVVPQGDCEALQELAQNQLTYQSDELAIFEGVSTLGFPITLSRPVPKAVRRSAVAEADELAGLMPEEMPSEDDPERYSGFEIPHFSEVPQFAKVPQMKHPPVKRHIAPLPESKERLDEPLLEPELPNDEASSGLFERAKAFKAAPDEDFWGDIPNPAAVDPEEGDGFAANTLHNALEIDVADSDDEVLDEEEALWATPTAEMLYGEDLSRLRQAPSAFEAKPSYTNPDEMQEAIEAALSWEPSDEHEQVGKPIWADSDAPEEGSEPKVVYREENILMSDVPYVMGGSDALLIEQEPDWAEPIPMEQIVIPSVEADAHEAETHPAEMTLDVEEAHPPEPSVEPVTLAAPTPVAPQSNVVPRSSMPQSSIPQQEAVPVYNVQDLSPSQGDSQEGFKAGERVGHEKYGQGVIKRVIPMDGSTILHIIFDSVGKRLMDTTSITKI